MSNATTKPTKAIVAGVVAFLGTLLATIQGRTDLDTMSWTAWLIVVLTAAVAAFAVYQTSNAPSA